ncbi:MAG: hypothetical protein ISR20_05095, partial [Candidatus Poseidonia sp.]|nr:hypothetical protein [Poseidonia sp.]
NHIAARYEHSLMWKMIGPHQGLRLERMRTEIERDKFVGVAKELPQLNRGAEINPMGTDVESTGDEEEPPS